MDILVIKARWQESYKKVVQSGSDQERDLVITPYFGHYGLAGYTIVVQGSPTHGLVVFELDRSRLVCIGSRKTVKIEGWDVEFEKGSKSMLYNSTLDLLRALDLRLEPGGADNPAVYYVRAGVQ